MRTWIVAPVLLLLLSAGWVSPAYAAPAQPLTGCGQKLLNGSFYLNRDLQCTTGFEVKAGEPGARVSVDLRGHRLSGPGTADSIAFDVRSFNASDNELQLSNGTVDRWGTGIAAYLGLVITTSVTLDRNENGAACSQAVCRFTAVRFTHNGTATSTDEDASMIFDDVVFLANTTASRVANRQNRGESRYDGVTFTLNRTGIVLDSGAVLTVARSRFDHNQTGVAGSPSTALTWSATVSDSVFTDNGYGVRVRPGAADRLTLTGNTVRGSRHYAIWAPGAVDGGGNTAAANARPCVGVVCRSPGG